MAFTTWQVLYQSMLDSFASGKHLIQSWEMNHGGNVQRFSYRTNEDFLKGLEHARIMAEAEAAPAPVRRTYAKPVLGR